MRCPDPGIRHLRHATIALVVALLALTGLACGDKSGTETEDCAANETYNPLKGCVPKARNLNPDTGGGTIQDTGVAMDTGGDPMGGDAGDTGDTSSADTRDVLPQDIGADVDQTCHPQVDTDRDGLSNACECNKSKTSPTSKDSDGDGVEDGVELDFDCKFDPNEGDTNPLDDDTDIDGLNDKEERNGPTDPLDPDSDDDGIDDGIEASTCTDPLKEDTDGDGLPDGLEDANQDGTIGTCMGRNFSPGCAQGESDPCSKDTNGDGTPDGDEVQYRKCLPEDTKNLPRPQIIKSMQGKYQLAVEKNVKAEAVSTQGVTAHVLEDKQHGYTGFVMDYSAMGQTDPSVIAGDITARIQSLYSNAKRRSTGRQITTHDNYKAVVSGIVDLPGGPNLRKARDTVLALLGNSSRTDIQNGHSLNTSFPNGTGEPSLFFYEVVHRAATNKTIVVGAFARLPDYQNLAKETGFRVDDIVGGTALAKTGEPLEAECISYEIKTVPKVDIIISLDASGSMRDEQRKLSNFATQFTNLLNRANLDWRVGVTSVACSNIKQDMQLSGAFRALWPMSGGFPPNGPCNMPFGGLGSSNGKLVGGNFTTSPTQIAQRLNNVNSTNDEYAMTMGVAAIDRAMPRMGGPSNFRKDASIMMVAITDENDGYFSETIPAVDNNARNKTISPAEQAAIEQALQPWVNYLLAPSRNATVFGLYWPPGEQCGTAANVAHGMAELVRQTGGTGGSVCQTNVQNTLGQIANAAAGLGSGLRLLGVPVAPSIQVKHVDVSANMGQGQVVNMDRSRSDGFDFDPIVNRISFLGSNPPETGDRVIVPYLRWKNSIKKCTKKMNTCPNKQVCVSGICR